MNIENIFVENFIVPRYRERLSYEFSSNKKREKAIDRFCHGAYELLDHKKVVKRMYSVTLQDVKDACGTDVVSENDSCYIIGGGVYDRSVVTLSQCLKNVLEEPTALIIVYKPYFAIVKEEFESGQSVKYILSDVSKMCRKLYV